MKNEEYKKKKMKRSVEKQTNKPSFKHDNQSDNLEQIEGAD